MQTIKRPLSVVLILVMLLNLVPNVFFSPISVNADTKGDSDVLYITIKEDGKDYSYFTQKDWVYEVGALRVDYMIDSQGNPVLCLEFDKDTPTEKIKYTKGGELSYQVQYIVEAFHGENEGANQMKGDSYKKYFIAQNAIRLVLGQIDKIDKSILEGVDMGHGADVDIADNINKLADMAKKSPKPAKPSLNSSLTFNTDDLTFTQGQDGNYYTELTSINADSTGILKKLNLSVNSSKVRIVNPNGTPIKNIEPHQQFKLKIPNDYVDGSALSIELTANADFKLGYAVPIKWVTTNSQYQSVTGYDYEHVKHSKKAAIKANLSEIKGAVEGLKVGSDGKKLNDVKIGLFDTKGDKIDETVTKDGGKFSFSNVDYGKAVVKEIAGVDGYVMSDKEYPVNITKDGQVVKIEIENKRIKGAVEGLKVGSDGKKLNDVKIGLFDTKGDKIDETVTKDGGKFSFSNVDYGKAVVKEIAGVDGYVMSDKEYPVNITKDGQVVKIEIENKRIKGAVEGLKVGSDGKKLNDVKIGLFDTKGDKIDETVTKDGGKFSFSNVDYGKAVVKEIAGVDGYVMSDKEYPVNITKDGQVVKIEIENKRIKGAVEGLKVGSDGKKLNDVKIGLFDTKGDKIDEAVTKDGGKFSFSNVDYGKAVVKEIAGVDGYVMSDKEYPVNITKDGQVVKIEIENKRIKGAVEGLKVGSDGKKLNDVKIGLFDTKGDKIDETVTKDGGKFSFSNVDYGKAVVKEIAGVDGYVMSDKEYPVNITKDGQVVKIEIENKRIKGAVEGLKVGSDGKKLNDVKIGLFDTKGDKIDETVTKDGGKFSFSNVDYGKAVVKEIAGVDGYVMSDKEYPVNITKDGQVVKIEIENKRIKGAVEGLKVGSDGKKLNDVKIGLFDTKGDKIDETVTKDGGKFSFSNVDYGKAVVKEIAGVDGYVMSDKEYPVNITKDGQVVKIEIENKRIKGAVEGLKVGSDGKKLNDVKIGLFDTKGDKIDETVTKDGGKFSFSNVDYGKAVVKEIAGVDGYVMSDKEYPVNITKDGQVVKIEIENKRIKGAVEGLKVGSDGKKLNDVKIGLFDTKGDKIDETVTKDGGKFSFSNVDYGKAVVKEIAGVDGYVMSDKEYPVNITKDGQVVKIEIENKRIKGAVEGLKVGSDGKKLNDVKIGLFDTKGDKIDETVTKDGGKFSFSNVDYGKAVVKEIAGVDGYVMSDKEYPVNITKDGQVVKIEIENKRIKGAVEGLKVGSDGKKLNDVKIGLFDTKGDKIDEAVTKDGGKFSFSNVDYGKAVVKEIAGVDGYVMSDKEYPVNITKDGQVVKIEIENKRIKGAVEGLKVGSDGKKLNDVKIGLFDTKGDKIDEAVTKDGGKFSFSNVDYGKAVVKEIAGVDGYVMSDKEYPVNITKDGQVVKIEIENKRIKGAVEGLKVGSDGKKLNDVKIGLFDTKGDKIDETVTKDGGKFSFSNVDYGKAVVKEIAGVDGYVMSDKEYPVNITKDGQVVKIEIENKRIKGAVEGLKVGSDGKKLNDVKIGLFDTKGDKIDETVTKDGGKFSFSNVDYGKAVVKEIAGVDGYVMSDKEYPVNITKDGQVVKIEIENKRIKGAVEGLKVGSDGKKLNDVKIGLFDTKGDKIDETVTKDGGKFSFSNVDYGKAVVKEIAGVDGYVMSDKEYPVNITKDGQVVKIEIENKRIKGAVEGLKVGSDGKKLNDVKIGLFDTKGDKIDETVTKDGGKFSFSNVDYGKAVVKEIAGVDGYVMSDKEYPVNITKDGQVVKIEIENKRIKGAVEGLKVGSDGKKLNDVKIGLFDTKGDKIDETATKDGGKFSFSNVDYGKAVVKEIAGVDGYVMSDKEYPVNITKDGQVVKIEIENKKEKVEILPKTGDTSGVLPIAIGALLIIAAGAILFKSKRKKTNTES